MERVRDAVYNNGIRTPQFFIDHDKLRSGLITANQVCNIIIITIIITGKFGGSFNLAIWRICPLITKLKFSIGRNVSAVVVAPETPN